MSQEFSFVLTIKHACYQISIRIRFLCSMSAHVSRFLKVCGSVAIPLSGLLNLKCCYGQYFCNSNFNSKKSDSKNELLRI